MDHYKFSQELPLFKLFTDLVDKQTSGCLRLSGGTGSWFIYMEQGKLLYATNSIDPFGRFDRYLRRLSVQVPSLVSAIRIQVRLLFETPSTEPSQLCQDYQAISWLVEQRHLNTAQATILIEELAKEVLESLLSVPEGDCELEAFEQQPLSLCQLDLPSLIEFCQSRLRQREAAGLPATMTASRSTSFTPTSAYSLSTLAQQTNTIRSNNNSTPKLNLPSTASKTTSHTIACIDDSPAVLQSINTFLSEENVSVIMINDPVKALMQVIRSKPDLILLDITMPNLDGYELCSLLRKHPSFRTTPVVMVTSNTGFIDRAKAKLVGASGYLTKPFTQTDLIKMIFKHLK